MKSSSLKANQTIKNEGPTKATLMWCATYSLSQFAICVLSCAKGFLEQKSIFQPSSTSFLWCGQPLDATLGFDTQWMARWLDFVCVCLSVRSSRTLEPDLQSMQKMLCWFSADKNIKKAGETSYPIHLGTHPATARGWYWMAYINITDI